MIVIDKSLPEVDLIKWRDRDIFISYQESWCTAVIKLPCGVGITGYGRDDDKKLAISIAINDLQKKLLDFSDITRLDRLNAEWKQKFEVEQNIQKDCQKLLQEFGFKLANSAT